MKFKFEIFQDCDRRTLEYFVRRLVFALYKPGDIIIKKGTPCQSTLLIIDGEAETRMTVDKSGNKYLASTLSAEERGQVKSYGPGSSYGEECFEMDFDNPHYLVCIQRCLTLNLSKRDFAEVMYY